MRVPKRLSAALSVALLLLLVAATAAHARTIVVTSNGDGSDKDVNVAACETDTGNGVCTLRAAIQQANHDTGFDEIHFAIGNGAVKIAPFSPLPTITDALSVKATTQPGAAVGVPVVELSGEHVPGTDGFFITAGASQIRGFVINRFQLGIRIEGPGLNFVGGNWIGTTADGTDAAGNTRSGIYIFQSPDNIIGGSAPGDKNVVSGNGEGDTVGGDGDVGIEIFGAGADHNQVIGNFIGLDATGTQRISNATSGIFVGTGNGTGTPNGVTIGDGTEAGRNYIAGNNEDGIYLLDTPNAAIKGNVIGLNVNGEAVDPNGGNSLHQRNGMTIEAAPSAIIGGDTAGERNVISNSFDPGNVGGDGVRFLGPGADHGIVRGNFLGTTLDGTSAHDRNGASTA